MENKIFHRDKKQHFVVPITLWNFQAPHRLMQIFAADRLPLFSEQFAHSFMTKIKVLRTEVLQKVHRILGQIFCALLGHLGEPLGAKQ